MKKTEVSVETESSVVQKDEDIKLIFHLTSHANIPCGKVIVFYQLIDAMGKCMTKSKIRLYNETEVTQIHVPYIGAYQVVVEKIYCFDILQCLFRKHKQEARCHFFIFPIYNPQYTFLKETIGFHDEASDYSPYISGEDYSEVSHIREYRDTDLLKHIHWKASLKKNELYVKEGSQPIIKKIILALQYSSSHSLNDQTIQRFYSLALSLIQKGIDFEVICPSINEQYPNLEFIKNDTYFKECFQRLLQSPILNLDECLSHLKDYPDVYVVNAQGIEVYHR